MFSENDQKIIIFPRSEFSINRRQEVEVWANMQRAKARLWTTTTTNPHYKIINHPAYFGKKIPNSELIMNQEVRDDMKIWREAKSDDQIIADSNRGKIKVIKGSKRLQAVSRLQR